MNATPPDSLSEPAPAPAPSTGDQNDVVPPPKFTTPLPVPQTPTLQDIARLIDHDQAFENTSTSVAASQMRNALNNLADTVQDPEQKKVNDSYKEYENSC